MLPVTSLRLAQHSCSYLHGRKVDDDDDDDDDDTAYRMKRCIIGLNDNVLIHTCTYSAYRITDR
jgi:hypothetical protein